MADKYFALEPISHSGTLYPAGAVLDGVDGESLKELVRVRSAAKLGESVPGAASANPSPDRAEREALARQQAEAEVIRLKAELAALQQAARDGAGGGAAIEMAEAAKQELAQAEVAAERSDEQSAAAEAATKGAAGASAKSSK